MIIVTGGAGFIGSNLVKALNGLGRTDIMVVDDLTDGAKCRNLVDCEIYDYMDKDDFLAKVTADSEFEGGLDALFHLGACSDTTETDGRYLMLNNYEYSKSLLHYCLKRRVAFIYASSASVYGGGTEFREERQLESPLNAYGYSKFIFDQYVRRVLPGATSQVVGMRYFNVYGPRESHKTHMASVAYHFNRQLLSEGRIALFEGVDGYANGEQRRDFLYVKDACSVKLWFLEHPECSGIFNLGTGVSRTFNDLAQVVRDWHGFGSLEYIPFPPHLRGKYQSFTEADTSSLRQIGCELKFKTIEEGIREYLHWLNSGKESAA